jgi:NitT/TauT family transport system permease protein
MAAVWGSGFIIALATLISVARVLAMMGASVASGWFLAYAAVKNKGFENVYVTVISVLESVPVIGFFPVVLLFFVTGVGGTLGVELAVDFLIFDAVVWNIWVGIYQAFKTVPKEWVEVAQNYGYGRLRTIWRVYVPFSVPRIAANLFPSLADGFFYLMVSEVVSVGLTTYRAFGIGSLISVFLGANETNLVYLSLLSLGVAIGLLTFAFRRFAGWAVAKFTVDTDIAIARRGKLRTRYSVIFSRSLYSNRMASLSRYARKLVPLTIHRIRSQTALRESHGAEAQRRPAYLKIGSISLVAALLALVSYGTVSLILSVHKSLWVTLLVNTPYYIFGLAVDYLRVAVITLSALGLAVTLGYLLAVNKKAEKIGMPMIQVFSAMPAPAYFPLIFAATYPAVHAVLNGLTNQFFVFFLGWISTFYYVLYSFWMGVKSLPAEYWEISRNLGMNFFQKMRRMLLPGTLPYLVSGLSSTINSAWGGLEIAEYWPNVIDGKSLYAHTGLIRDLDVATFQGNFALAGWLSLLFGVAVTIYALLFTRRLMETARKRYVAEEGIYAA